MNKHLEMMKDDLDLSTLESDFLNFAGMCLGINEDTRADQVYIRLQPWFGTGTDGDKIFTQVYSEYVHQKYRIALDFCAQHAGYQSVEYKELGEEIIAISRGLFWFRGMHPAPIKWIMTTDNRVLTSGEEYPYTIQGDTLEEWLLEHIKQIGDTKKHSGYIGASRTGTI